MSGLPQTRIANNPLVVLALSLAFGIFVFQYFAKPRLAIVVVVAAVVVFSIAAALVLRVVSPIAIAFLLVAFVGTGYLLALVEARSVSPNRIVPMFERGELLSGEPVEVSGTIQGQPESAPDGFYLTLRADCIRSKDGDHSALGEVLLLAHAGDQSLRSEYDALQLRHGARIRVMTVLDRDEDYRNPGVQPFTEYLERQGYDATGEVKSPLLVERLDDARVFLPVAWLYEWRQHLEAEFDRCFSAETAG